MLLRPASVAGIIAHRYAAPRSRNGSWPSVQGFAEGRLPSAERLDHAVGADHDQIRVVDHDALARLVADVELAHDRQRRQLAVRREHSADRQVGTDHHGLTLSRGCSRLDRVDVPHLPVGGVVSRGVIRRGRPTGCGQTVFSSTLPTSIGLLVSRQRGALALRAWVRGWSRMWVLRAFLATCSAVSALPAFTSTAAFTESGPGGGAAHVNAGRCGAGRGLPALTAYLAVNAARPRSGQRRAPLTAYLAVNAGRAQRLDRLPAFTRAPGPGSARSARTRPGSPRYRAAP